MDHYDFCPHFFIDLSLVRVHDGKGMKPLGWLKTLCYNHLLLSLKLPDVLRKEVE
jgi:hypothetical protein